MDRALVRGHCALTSRQARPGQAEQTAAWPDQGWGKIEEKLSGLTVSLQAMLSEDPVRGRVEGGIHDSFL
jgi:hypothetical protein